MTPVHCQQVPQTAPSLDFVGAFWPLQDPLSSRNRLIAPLPTLKFTGQLLAPDQLSRTGGPNIGGSKEAIKYNLLTHQSVTYPGHRRDTSKILLLSLRARSPLTQSCPHCTTRDRTH